MQETINSPNTLQAWRIEVLRRDKYRCQECGSADKLEAHHILLKSQYPEKAFDIQNGVTLCKTCHDLKHPEIKLRTLRSAKPRVKDKTKYSRAYKVSAERLAQFRGITRGAVEAGYPVGEAGT